LVDRRSRRPLLLILGLQTAAAVAFILPIFFRFMGGDYQAEVLSAGFGGFALGATPTAIANMTAAAKSRAPHRWHLLSSL
jgi:ESS family glutamate:Na+ symporter